MFRAAPVLLMSLVASAVGMPSHVYQPPVQDTVATATLPAEILAPDAIKAAAQQPATSISNLMIAANPTPLPPLTPGAIMQSVAMEGTSVAGAVAPQSAGLIMDTSSGTQGVRPFTTTPMGMVASPTPGMGRPSGSGAEGYTGAAPVATAGVGLAGAVGVGVLGMGLLI